MVVNDLHVVGVTIAPAKADAPLIVDSYAVLPCTVSPELLEPVPRWDPEISQSLRSIEQQQLPKGQVQDRRWPPAHTLPVEDAFGVPTPEALDHLRNITYDVNNVKRYGPSKCGKRCLTTVRISYGRTPLWKTPQVIVL